MIYFVTKKTIKGNKMEAKLIVNGHEISVGIELLGRIVSDLADYEENQEIFHILAQSASANIRQEIAYKDNISEETAMLLLNDKDITVLERIINNNVAKELIDDDILNNIMENANEELLKEIASNFDSFENISADKIANKLIELENPYVTLSIAENYSSPKKILKSLLKHSDPDIVRAAKSSLE